MKSTCQIVFSSFVKLITCLYRSYSFKQYLIPIQVNVHVHVCQRRGTLWEKLFVMQCCFVLVFMFLAFFPYFAVGGYHHQPPPPHMHESHYPHHPHTHHPPHPGGPSGVHLGQYDYEAYYTAMSSVHIQNLAYSEMLGQQATPTTAPPPPDLQPIIDKTAEYVVKNGDNFEMTVLKRHAGDNRFNFLNPWDEYHSYYLQQKNTCRERAESEHLNTEKNSHPFTAEKNNVQKLSSSGAVSFKLQPKLMNLAVSSSVNHFDEELDDSEEFVEGDDEQKDWQEEGNEESESFEPQAKKQRLEDDDDGGRKPDQIGFRVQVRFEY